MKHNGAREEFPHEPAVEKYSQAKTRSRYYLFNPPSIIIPLRKSSFHSIALPVAYYSDGSRLIGPQELTPLLYIPLHDFRRRKGKTVVITPQERLTESHGHES